MTHNNGNGSCSSNNVKEIRFSMNTSVYVSNIMIQTDTRLMKNDSLFTMVDMKGQRQSFLSPISGTVSKLYVNESDILSYGSIILEYEECRHTITFKNLCGDCGINLKQLNNTLPVPNCAKSIILMKPSFSQVRITSEEALRFDNEERNYLLRKRKLHLLVDLDQTLVHTTNSANHYPSSADVVAYQLNNQTFYTKLRPGVKEFLTNLRSLYQFHIVTFGDRPYANTIAKIIDPDKTFFFDRILSRDECLSSTDKTANLSTLFPGGDSLVCIIDDREDVWNYAPNLVPVKPYMWFKDVGDINGIHLPSPSIPRKQMISPISEQVETSEERHQPGKKRKFYTDSDASSKMEKKHNNKQGSTVNHPSVVLDTDIYLHQLEIILKRIHTTFYTAYDRWIQEKNGSVPDLKQIIPTIRGQILSSVSLCFSHLMPQGYPMEKHRATIIAQALGAKVTHDLQIHSNGTMETTHVIAGMQTSKVYHALQNNIKVVTPEWLTDCYEQWEKKPEENYILTPEYDVQKSKLFVKEIPRASKRRYEDMQENASVTRQSFSHQHMTIDRTCSQTNNEDSDHFNDTCSRPSKQQRTAEILDENLDDNDDGFDSDSSSIQRLHDLVLGKNNGDSSDEEYLSDDETPRGWKKAFEQKRYYS